MLFESGAGGFESDDIDPSRCEKGCRNTQTGTDLQKSASALDVDAVDQPQRLRCLTNRQSQTFAE
jgi:hypothetical protein